MRSLDFSIKALDEAIARDSKKYSGMSANELERSLEKDGYKVDASTKIKGSGWVYLVKNGKKYDAEVTKYSNGEYEIMAYNINPSR